MSTYEDAINVAETIRIYQSVEKDIIRLTGCNLCKLKDMLEDKYEIKKSESVEEVNYKQKYDELKVECNHLRKRLKHLLESDFIASFDRFNPRTNSYQRNISEADKIIESLEELHYRAKGI